MLNTQIWSFIENHLNKYSSHPLVAEHNDLYSWLIDVERREEFQKRVDDLYDDDIDTMREEEDIVTERLKQIEHDLLYQAVEDYQNHEDNVFASIRWHTEDIKSIAPNISEAKVLEVGASIGKKMTERSIEEGWEILRYLINDEI